MVSVNILLDQKAIDDVIAELEIEYKLVEKICMQGLTCNHKESKEFFVESDHNAKAGEFLIVSIDDQGVWELDKFLNPVAYKKRKNCNRFICDPRRYLHVCKKKLCHEQWLGVSGRNKKK